MLCSKAVKSNEKGKTDYVKLSLIEMGPGPGKRKKVTSGQREEFAPGTVVWARVRYYPWWPAVVVPAAYSLFTETATVAGEPGTLCVLFFADCRLSFLPHQDIKEFTAHRDLHTKDGRWAEKIGKAAAAAENWLSSGALIVLPQHANLPQRNAARKTPTATATTSTPPPSVTPGSAEGAAENAELVTVKKENARLQTLLSSVAGAAQGLAVLANDFSWGTQKLSSPPASASRQICNE